MTRVKISTTEEWLAILPHQLGYRLDDCVAVVMVTDKVISPIARVDLPEPRHVRTLADQLLTSLLRIEPQQAFLVGYENVPGEARALMTRLHRGLARGGVGIIDHVVVRDGRWWGWCCRPPHQLEGLLVDHVDGHPVPDDTQVPAVAEFIAHGSAPLASRHEFGNLVAEDPTVSLGVGDALQRLWEPLLEEIDPDGLLEDRLQVPRCLRCGEIDGPVTACPDPTCQRCLEDPCRAGHDLSDDWDEVADDELLAERSSARDRAARWPQAVERVPELWARVLEQSGERGDDVRFADDEVARLVLSLGNRAWRDSLIAWMSPVMFPLDRVDAAADAALRRAVATGPATTSKQSATVLRRLQGLARRVPDEWSGHAAAICAVVGCVAWGLGNGSAAGDAITRALGVDPGYRLALYLDQMITHQIRPERQWSDAAA